MKINVDSVPADGLEIEEDIHPDKLSLDIKQQGITFIGNVHVKGNFKKTGSELIADIFLEAPLECTCARCLAKIENIFKKDFNVSYEVKQGDVVNIDEDIRQEIILDCPVKALCRPDCKGLCPNCGQNLNVAECGCIGIDGHVEFVR